MGIILVSRTAALGKLRKRGITVLDNVRVEPRYVSTYSYCQGYEEPNDVKIYVAGSYVAGDLWGAPDIEGLTGILIHEYGHALLFKAWPVFSRSHKAQFTQLFGDYTNFKPLNFLKSMFDEWRPNLGLKPRTYNKQTHASVYATTNAHEDWAETFEALITGTLPRHRGTVLSKKVAFVREVIRQYGDEPRVAHYRS